MKKLLVTLAILASAAAYAGTQKEAEDATQRKDYAKALIIWNELAETNDADAQYWVGNFYDFGKGVEVNKEQAFYWYLKAARGGELTSQVNIGNMYKSGIGIKKDLQQSTAWYKKAADRGDEDAQYKYGFALHNGEGVKKDFDLAYNYFKAAALAGQPDAQHAVGLYLTDLDLFEHPSKTEKNKSFFDAQKMGLRWFKLAADAGSKNSQSKIDEFDSESAAKKRLGDLIGQGQTGISSSDNIFARPGVYKVQDQKRTKYGDIGVYNEKNKSFFVFQRNPLEPSVEAKNIIRIDEAIALNNKVYVLLMVDNADKGCFGNFSWVTLTKDGITTTDRFGNCSGIADVTVKGGELILRMPKFRGGEASSYSKKL